LLKLSSQSSGAYARLARVKNVIELAIPKMKNTLLPGLTFFPIATLILPKNTITVGKRVGGKRTETRKAAVTKIRGSDKLAIAAKIQTHFKNF
jgi:hypothetical protein